MQLINETCKWCGLDNMILVGNQPFCRNCQPFHHKDEEEHFNKLLEAKSKKVENPEKILIFQPIALGDLVVSSLSAELFQIKYPGCTVDYLTETQQVRDILSTNPYINEIKHTLKWDDFRHRNTLQVGDVAKNYSKIYGLYWWTPIPTIIHSFLEDLELPTNYTRLRFYTTSKQVKNAQGVWENNGKLKIGLQYDIDLKWKGDKEKLRKRLEEYGNVVIIGPPHNYLTSAEIVRQADIIVCNKGSLSHISGAVGTPTITISPVYNPNDVCCAYYQNKYMPKNRQHLVVTPEPNKWCQDYNRCVTYDMTKCPQNTPPYGFNSKRFPPYVWKQCDWGYGCSTCVKEISIDKIMEVFLKFIGNL